jgi:Second Messenger Oligonucleotide or Dinucleotide Synthetase domain
VARIQPTTADLDRYAGHRRTVTTRLKSTLGAGTILPIGSFPRGTALHNGSDLDLMVQLPVSSIQRGGHRNEPVTVLKKIRDELDARYPDTDLRGSGPAISVWFAKKKYMVDVVPAIFDGVHEGIACFKIPSRDNRWILACPAEHNRLLKAEDERSGGKLRHTCQLIKFWMRCRQPRIPLHSFTAEMFIATAGICRGAKSYASCFTDGLLCLYKNLGEVCEDPTGVSTEMTLVDTPAKSERAANALDASATRAIRAIEAEAGGNFKESIRLWNIVFNGYFPLVARHKR